MRQSKYSFHSGVKRWEITESQNDWGRKAPLEVICSTPTPLKQGQLQPHVQGHVQTGLVSLLGQRLQSLFGKLVSVLGQSHSDEGFPDIRGHLIYFIWWLLSLAFSLDMNEENLALLCPLPSGYFVHSWHHCPWVFSRLKSPSPLNLSEQRGSKLIILVTLYWILSSPRKILCCQAFASTSNLHRWTKVWQSILHTLNWPHQMQCGCTVLPWPIKSGGLGTQGPQPSANLSKSQI